MKFLFVCEKNQCRSVMAEYFFKKYHPGHEVSSAGTAVFEQGRVAPISVWQALNEKGIDVKHHRTRQLTPSIYERSDKMIILNGITNLPDYASVADCWNIPDPRNEADIRQTRDTIEKKIMSMEI